MPAGPRAGSPQQPPLRRQRGYFERVWAVIRKIPKGRVATYGAVAEAAGYPGTARQVVWALNGAPRGLGLPWYRVLGAGGRILLPAAKGAEQRLRLETEGVTFVRDRVNMVHHEAELRMVKRGRPRSRTHRNGKR